MNRRYLFSDRVSQSIQPLKAENVDQSNHDKETNKRKSINIEQEKESQAKRVKGGQSDNAVKSSKTVSHVDEAVDDQAEIELTLSATEREEFSDELEDFIVDKEKEDLLKKDSDADKAEDSNKGNNDQDDKEAPSKSDDCTNVETLQQNSRIQNPRMRQGILLDTIQGKLVSNCTNKKRGGKATCLMLKWLETCLDTIELNGTFLDVNIQKAKTHLRKLFGCLTCSKCIALVGNELDVTAFETESSKRLTKSSNYDLCSKLTPNSQTLVPKIPTVVAAIPGNSKNFTGTVQKTSITLLDGAYSKTNIETYSSQSQPMMFDNSARQFQIATQATHFHQGFENFSMNNGGGNMNQGFHTFQQPPSSFPTQPQSSSVSMQPNPSTISAQSHPPTFSTQTTGFSAQPQPLSFSTQPSTSSSFQPPLPPESIDPPPPPPGMHTPWPMSDGPSDDPKVSFIIK